MRASVFSILILLLFSCAEDTSDIPLATGSTQAAPSNVTVVALADTAALLTWTYAGAVTRFEIEVSSDSVSFTDVDTAIATARQYLHRSPIIAGTTYIYRLRAVTSDRQSAFISTQPLSIALLPPSDLQIQAIADSAIALSWQMGAGFQTGFELDRKTGSGPFSIFGIARDTSRFYRDTISLLLGESYTYRVRAVSKHNQSAYVTSTPLAADFTPPTNVHITSHADTAVDVFWDYSAAFQTGFEVERQTGGGPFIAIGTTGATTHTLRDAVVLQDGQTYTWRVRTMNGATPSAYESSVALAASLAPPSNVNVFLTTISATITWADNSNIERTFVVARSDDGSSFNDVIDVPAGATSAFVEGAFASGSSYSFRVRAVAASEGAASSVVSATAGAPELMTFVVGGWFFMGDSSGQSDELPVDSVTVSSLYMDETEVLFDMWTQVRSWGLSHGYTDLPPGRNGSDGGSANHPVTEISWFDAVKWSNARSEMEGLEPAYYTDGFRDTVYRVGTIPLTSESVKWNSSGHRLPTEAEWEYAAHAGSARDRFRYSGGDSLPAVAWYIGNAAGNTHNAKSKSPNSLGLYDMSGNVQEWVWDWYGPYTRSGKVDPRGPATGNVRVVRGGSYRSMEYACTVSYRNLGISTAAHLSYVGFRTVRK